MSIASSTGRVLGIVVAEVQWLVEKGATPIAGVAVAKAAYDVAKSVAESHTIDKTDPDAITQNVFECLEYID